MKRKIFSILFALVLGLSFSLVTAVPAAANGTTTTLTVPDNVYRPAEFVASSTTTNSGTAYDTVRFNITVDGPVDFTGDRANTFTITKVNGSSETQGINDTFTLVGGDWVGYWGTETGFPLTDGYDATSTFTIEMCDVTTAPLGNYDVTVELVDLSPEPDVTLATATDSFSLGTDTLYVGTTQYQYQFNTIQDAVDAATETTIIVAAGTYDENITVNKLLTLLGPNADVNPVTAGRGTEAIINGGGTGDAVTISSDDVTIKGFEITNGTLGIVAGARSGLEISNNIIHHNINPVDQQGCGITIWAAAGPCNNNLIENNVVYSNERQGIFIGTNEAESNSTGNTVRGNKVYDNGTDGYDSFGIQLNYASGNTIENNEVYGHTYTSVSWLASGIYLYNANNNNIVGNNIHDNNDGICQWIPDGTVQALEDNEAHFNNIVDNTGSGIGNFTAEAPINATDNWWGSASGPTHDGNTYTVPTGDPQGDAVSDNVDYVPWLDGPFATGTSFAPVTKNSLPTYYSSIQAALDDASAGDTITCAAGTYHETHEHGHSGGVAVDIPWFAEDEAGLTIQSSDGPENTIIDCDMGGVDGWAGWGVQMVSNNITFTGFTVKNAYSVINQVSGKGHKLSNLIVTDFVNYGLGVAHGVECEFSNITIHTNDVSNSENRTVKGIDFIGYGSGGNNDCQFEDITIYDIETTGTYGTSFGIYWSTSSTFPDWDNTFTDVTIHDLSAENWMACGIYIKGRAPGTTPYAIENTTFSGGNIYNIGGDAAATRGFYVDGGCKNLNITGFNIGCDKGIYFSHHSQEACNNVDIHYNNIVGTTEYGVQDYDGDNDVDAKYNWWGDISGPKQATTNPRGEGDEVSDNVDYQPWLNRDFQTVLDDNIAYFGIPMVELNTGWNIMSTPIALDPYADTWGEYVALGDPDLHIHGTNPAYSFNAQTGAFVALTGDYQLRPCDAIYVRMSEADIAPILYSPNTSVPSRDVYSGWNLVGLANLEDMAVNDALTSVYKVAGDLTGYSQVVSPSIGNQTAWVFIRDGTAQDMQRTKGYWVFMVNAPTGTTLAGFTFTPQSLP